MTNEEAIKQLEWVRNIISKSCFSPESFEAINIAIGAIKRDTKVDDITFHWNDNKNNFVTACIAFEEILKVYGRGVDND